MKKLVKLYENLRLTEIDIKATRRQAESVRDHLALVAEPIVRVPLLEPEVASKRMGVIDRIDTGIDRQSF